MAERNGKFGWINLAGEWVIPPQYDELHQPSSVDGLAWAKRGEIYGVVDSEGCWIRDLDVSELETPMASATSIARKPSDQGGGYSLIDHQGEWRIDRVFGYARYLAESREGYGLILFISERPSEQLKSDQYILGVSDNSGRWLSPPTKPRFWKHNYGMCTATEIAGLWYRVTWGEKEWGNTEMFVTFYTNPKSGRFIWMVDDP